MQYALMIYAEPGYGDALPEAERDGGARRISRAARRFASRRGARLEPAETATSVRVVGGRTLMTDGPFADTKEVLGGFAMHRGGEPRRGGRAGRAHPGRPATAAPSKSGRWCDALSTCWSRSSGTSGAGCWPHSSGSSATSTRPRMRRRKRSRSRRSAGPTSGSPANPGAWLVTTARNRAIDRIRRERTLAEKLHLLPVPETTMDEFDDDA